MKNNYNFKKYIATSIILVGVYPIVNAATLMGSGNNLPLSSLPHGTPVGRVVPTLTSVTGGFTGTWGNPAHPDWHGTFTATGSIPSNQSSDSANWNFTSLALGYLPGGTIFVLSDLDESATITFKAYDASGGVLTHWLDDTSATLGTGAGPGGSAAATDLPGWQWDAGNSTYIFDGSTVVGNPNIGVYLKSNQSIASLDAATSRGSYNYGIFAQPVPEPSSSLLLGLGGLGLIMRRKRVF